MFSVLSPSIYYNSLFKTVVLNTIFSFHGMQFINVSVGVCYIQHIWVSVLLGDHKFDVSVSASATEVSCHKKTESPNFWSVSVPQCRLSPRNSLIYIRFSFFYFVSSTSQIWLLIFVKAMFSFQEQTLN